MERFRSIDIDVDVHKRIEAERRDFGEAPNDVLRRLLGLAEPKPRPNEREPAPTGKPWIGKLVLLPHGTKLVMDYNSQQYKGLIENGEWVIDGKRYRSPSAAAKGVAITKAGTRASLDGWLYWRALPPGAQEWERLEDMRRNAIL